MPKFVLMGSPLWSILVCKIPEFWRWKLWDQNFVPFDSGNIHIEESKEPDFTFSIELRTKFVWSHSLTLLCHVCTYGTKKVPTSTCPPRPSHPFIPLQSIICNYAPIVSLEQFSLPVSIIFFSICTNLLAWNCAKFNWCCNFRKSRNITSVSGFIIPRLKLITFRVNIRHKPR